MRIALVGCGRWGRHILRDLTQLGCEVVVVARSPESRTAADEGGATVIVPTVDDLPECSGTVVATPTITHAEVIESLLPRRAPIFVEKPMTADLSSARRLASRQDVFVMDKWRYHPGIEALREIVRSGELGRPEMLRTVRVGWGHRYSDVDTVWIHAPHDLAIVLEILGSLPPARTATPELMGEAVTGLVATLGDGPRVTLDVSASSHRRRREVRLICEYGVAWLEHGYADRIGVVHGQQLGASPEWRPISTEMPLLRELRAFVEHLAGGARPRSNAAEGALTVERVCELRSLAELGPRREASGATQTVTT